MSNLHIQLSFTTGELVSPVARIFVTTVGRDGDPNRYISPDCATQSEFDHAIDFLHAELEKVRAKGHAKFKALILPT